jgi:hypothetical protein
VTLFGYNRGNPSTVTNCNQVSPGAAGLGARAWKGVSMWHPHPVHGSRTRLFVFCVVVSSFAAGCSGVAESGDTAIVIEITASSISVENRTGMSLARGQVELFPQGIPRPYVTLLPYMASGEKRTFPLTGFRAQDGTKYRSDIAKGKSVKVTATDSNGQVREREVPYK